MRFASEVTTYCYDSVGGHKLIDSRGRCLVRKPGSDDEWVQPNGTHAGGGVVPCQMHVWIAAYDGVIDHAQYHVAQTISASRAVAELCCSIEGLSLEAARRKLSVAHPGEAPHDRAAREAVLDALNNPLTG